MIWAQALLVAWMLHALAGRSRLTALLLAPLAFVPIGDGMSLAVALRGFWGDPSITGLQLMLLGLAGRVPVVIRRDWRLPALVGSAGIALYVSALGSGNVDLYRFGFQPLGLVALLGTAAIIAWWRGVALPLWLLAIDLLAWRAGWMESANLWDILLDPLLVGAMLVLAVRNGYRAHRDRKLLLAQP